MTVEMDNPGVSGYGYTGQDKLSHAAEPHLEEATTSQPPEPATASSAQTVQDAKDKIGSEPTGGYGISQDLNDSQEGAHAQPDDYTEIREKIAFDRQDEVPGYERAACICINRSRQIARSLNHTSMGTDHLMLALTMDQNARRLLERVSDVTQLRVAAMQRLGHYGSARDSSEQSIVPTSDLGDIAKAARDAANEREQSVAISDLINAFPKSNGRLTYGSDEAARAVPLIEKIEKGLIPLVADSMTKIETVVVDALQQSQTVQKMLLDLSSKQSYEAEQRQVAFMDDIRQQVREALDDQVGSALKDFREALVRDMDEVKAVEEDAPREDSGDKELPPLEAPKSKPGPWGWLGLI